MDMSKALFFKQNRLALASASIALLLVACGGGSSSSDTPENQAETPTTSEPSSSATESHYKEIAGTWEASIGVGDGTPAEKFKFTIDLNGVGRWKGDLVYVTRYVSRKEIVLKPRCITGPDDCRDDKIAYGDLKSSNTKIRNGYYAGYGEVSTFEATKIKGI